MFESMHVYVTDAELDEVHRLYADADLTGDNTKLVGYLQGCCLKNGGDFSALRARLGVETQLRIVRTAEHVQVKLTVVREEPINGQEKG